MKLLGVSHRQLAREALAVPYLSGRTMKLMDGLRDEERQ